MSGIIHNVSYETSRMVDDYTTEYLRADGTRAYLLTNTIARENAEKAAKKAEIDAISTIEDIKAYLKKKAGLI